MIMFNAKLYEKHLTVFVCAGDIPNLHRQAVVIVLFQNEMIW